MRGRFAPSPTGPLHFGSIVAALTSYLDARAHRGEWLVRMEDLDQARVRAGAAENILRTLELFGFEYDGAVMRQSERIDAYRSALDELHSKGLVYGCACSRREAAACRCREGLPAGRRARAWRFRSSGESVCFGDRVQGRICETPPDFIVLRSDGFFAYQIAVVVDDAAQEITDVVRGADLLDSTSGQIALQRALGLAQPAYMHVPVALGKTGEKLSKQNLAPAVDSARASEVLRAALVFLGQPAVEGTPSQILLQAVDLWSPDAIPRSRELRCAV